MSMLPETVLNFVQNSHFAATLLDTALKSLAVLALAGIINLLWRRASAATRHWIWFLAVISLPLLPLSFLIAPTPQKPLWSISTRFDSGNQVSLAIELAPASVQNVSRNEPPPPPVNPGTRANEGAPASRPQLSAQFSKNWLLVAVLVWLGGTLLMLISAAAGQFWLRRLSRRSQPLHGASWQALLDDAREMLGLRREVRLLESAGNLMPLTWGWWKPAVLLPADAAQWPEERRRVVLLHELAHVKRRDCLTQLLTRIVCALYWFNPLVWVAARRMRVERERAADDLVLNGGCEASDYAGHLVDIARSFRRVPQTAGIAMARASGLEKRVAAIVDASRTRRMRPITVLAFSIVAGALIWSIGGWSAESNRAATTAESALRQNQIDQLKAFSAAKEKQAKTLAEAEGEPIGHDYQWLFDAAKRGDVSTVTNLFEDFKNRHGQYGHSAQVRNAILAHTAFWSPVLEVNLAYEHVANCDPKFTQIAVNGIIGSIPRGSIYFGGTDPGRGLPTAYSKSQIDADPFYTLTQNALADATYLDYLRETYGEESKLLNQFISARHADPELRTLDAEFDIAQDKLNSLYADTNYDLNGPEIQDADRKEHELKGKMDERANALWVKVKEQAGEVNGMTIYIPSAGDLQKCFSEYLADAKRRLEHDQRFPNEPRQIKPGENVKIGENGRTDVSGQIAVMAINARLAKIIFDKNPSHEFYVEESFPLDWMFPHLEPNGLIMKINREPLSMLSEEVVQRDHEYWQKLVAGMIGDWLHDDTSVQTVADFAEKTFIRKDLGGFQGDPNFVRDNYAPKMFSKWRSAIGGVYAWRLGTLPGVPTPSEYLLKNYAERQRMIKEADFAYRQAFATCPYSPEVMYRYVNLLMSQSRISDALLIAKTASHADPNNEPVRQLIRQLQQMNGSASAPLQPKQ